LDAHYKKTNVKYYYLCDFFLVSSPSRLYGINNEDKDDETEDSEDEDEEVHDEVEEVEEVENKN
jgi:Ran GTPase-activating protein (RanGAP) involved in mRNA processing and transport